MRKFDFKNFDYRKLSFKQVELRRFLPTILIIMGVVLLAYVGTEYGSMYAEQRRLKHEWEQQQVTLKTSGPSAGEIAQRGLTRISIPKIDLSAMVVEGTSHKALNVGPGHLKGTALPGQQGNSVLSAHRDSFFRHIVELGKGDQVMVQRDGKTYTYEVAAKKIVKPTEISVIQPTKDNRLTLITCYPTYYIGPAPERLIVTAKLVGDPEQAPSEDKDKQQNTNILPGDEGSK